MDEDGKGLVSSSLHGIPFLNMMKGCEIDVVETLVTARNLAKCMLLFCKFSLNLVSNFDSCRSVLRTYGLQRLRRLVSNVPSLRRKFHLDAEKIKYLNVDQCVFYLVEYKKSLLPQADNVDQ